MSLLAKLARLAKMLVDLQPLTFSGLMVAAGGSLALGHYGLARLDFILLVLGGALLVVLGVALLSTLATAALIGFKKEVEELPALEGECEFWVRTGFSLPRRRWLPFSTCSWTWLEPQAELRARIVGAKLEEWVFVRRRGESDSLRRRFDIGDVFGLTRMRFEKGESRRVRFFPSVGGIERVDVVRGVSGGDDFAHPEGPTSGSPYDLRPYAPGDPLRFILWKVFARTRELVVRSPERALSPAQQAVAYLVTDARDEPAAGTARAALDAGALGEGWLFGADGSEADAEAEDDALALLVASAGADPNKGGSGLASFLARAAPGGEQRAVVFVPPRPGPWIDRVLNAFDGRRGHMEFVVCIDGAQQEDEAPRSRMSKWMWADPEQGRGHDRWSEVLEVVEALRGPHAQVVVIDRRNGSVYADAYLEKMAKEAA